MLYIVNTGIFIFFLFLNNLVLISEFDSFLSWHSGHRPDAKKGKEGKVRTASKRCRGKSLL